MLFFFFQKNYFTILSHSNSLAIDNPFIKGLGLQISKDLHIYFTSERGREACLHEESPGLKNISLQENY